jgi:NAD(P)-dependent dehydrogenase (short-subunit alcohol dehydrogenase family)
MRIEDSVAFVTGANRGLGLAFAKELLGRGVEKLYAGVRNPDGVDLPGVIPVKFDVTDPAAVSAAAHRCGDVTLLINNAGIGRVDTSALDPAVIGNARETFETNFYGIIRASQAFVPVLSANGGGAIINVLSEVTWFCAADKDRLFGHEIRGVELHQRIADRCARQGYSGARPARRFRGYRPDERLRCEEE